MFNLSQMKEIASKQNVIFYKKNCPFCRASEVLIKALLELEIISEYQIYYLDQDFDNDLLKNLVLEYGWQAEDFQRYPTKPQIFINSEYIGGNWEFYKSRYNLGDNGTGVLQTKNGQKNTPKLINPMRF